MEDKNPKVSIILPVYNAEKFLDENLLSILNQSFEDFEFIIINDESKDKSAEIIQRYAEKDKRIIFLNNEKNMGCVKTRNKGLKLARGEYIAVMDPDDVCLTDRFKIQVDYLDRHPEIFLIGGSAIVIDEEGNRMGILLKEDNPEKIAKKMVNANCMIHPSVMHRNTQEFFYREKFIISDDYDFLLMVLSTNKKMSNVPEFIVKYRINKGSATNTKKNPEFFFKIAKEFYRQRVETGKDDYDQLDLDKVQPKMVDFNKLNSKTKIVVGFQDNQMKNVRKEIKDYIKTYNFEKQLAAYYLLSFLPIGFTKLLRKKL